ncbi:MAG: hypothetical protein ACLFR1_12075 [Spirochaetia bacterium]
MCILLITGCSNNRSIVGRYEYSDNSEEFESLDGFVFVIIEDEDRLYLTWDDSDSQQYPVIVEDGTYSIRVMLYQFVLNKDGRDLSGFLSAGGHQIDCRLSRIQD